MRYIDFGLTKRKKRKEKKKKIYKSVTTLSYFYIQNVNAREREGKKKKERKFVSLDANIETVSNCTPRIENFFLIGLNNAYWKMIRA